MKESADEAKLTEKTADGDGDEQRKRIDLALRSNEHLLVVEFMRPGKRADWDHLTKCERYVLLVRRKTRAQTALGISRVTGLIVADQIERDPSVEDKIAELRKSDILGFTWESLLEQAEETWREFLVVVGTRASGDERIERLRALASGG